MVLEAKYHSQAVEEKNIKVSIVIPCLNEEKTIAETVKNALEGLALANIKGEVIIVDSSTDNSPKIASELGARVISVPKRGLGRAYIDAISHINGEYVIMGDADCTYDFKEVNKFVSKLDEGYDFVMGTRMKGVIGKGAMPPLHRYFGTPLTTWILNMLLGTKFSDIHCGLRALTIDALKKIDIQSESWEYASEMIVKAGLLKLKTAEVPIHFYKDKEGRKSHHKRAGWFSPWLAGWINLKVMLLYAPNQMILKPGFVFLLLGLFLIFMQIQGPVTIANVTFSTGTMILGLAFSVMGLSSIHMGILVESFSDLQRYYQRISIKRFYKHFTYTKGMILGAISFLVGLVLSSSFVYNWWLNSFQLKIMPWYVIFGLLLIIAGIQTVLFNLAYHAFSLKRDKKNDN